MFSTFYKEENDTKEKLKYALYDSMKMDVLMEPIVDYKRPDENGEKREEILFKWNGQVNSCVAIIYDLITKRLPNNKFLLEADLNDLVTILSRHVIDKKGKKFNENTIRTCLKESKYDKRPQGDKRYNFEDLI